MRIITERKKNRGDQTKIRVFQPAEKFVWLTINIKKVRSQRKNRFAPLLARRKVTAKGTKGKRQHQREKWRPSAAT